MLNIARRCVPFTPFDKELSTAIVTLVSATGVHLPDQTPFPEEDPGDTTYRLIPGTFRALSACTVVQYSPNASRDMPALRLAPKIILYIVASLVP